MKSTNHTTHSKANDEFLEFFEFMVEHHIGLRRDLSMELGHKSVLMQQMIGTEMALDLKDEIDQRRPMLDVYQESIDMWRRLRNERQRQLDRAERTGTHHVLRASGYDREPGRTGDSAEQQHTDARQADRGIRSGRTDSNIWPDEERQNPFRADIDG